MDIYFKNNTNIEQFDNQHFKLYLKKNNIRFIPKDNLATNFYNLMAGDYIDNDISSALDPNIHKEEDIEIHDKILSIYEQNKDILNKFNILESALLLSKIYSEGKNPKNNGEDAFNLGSKDIELTFKEMMDLDIDELFYLNELGGSLAFNGRSKSLIRDFSGEISKFQHMEQYSELLNSDILAHFLPNFEQKLATKDLLVRAKYRYESKAENLIILVDRSSSMSDNISQTRAVLRKKLKKMRKGDRIFFSYFEMALYGFIEIKYDEIDSFLAKPIIADGGGTNASDCIKHMMKDLEQNKIGKYNLSKKTHFEVLIINDGQDSIDKSYHPQIKTHCISVEKENEALKTLCLRSGGSYMVI